MGEAKRRKASLKDMFDQAQGVFEGRLYMVKDVAPALAAILAGSYPKTDYDRNIIVHIAGWTRMMQTARKPPLCLLCDYEFFYQKQMPEAFYWMLPHRTDLREIAGSLSGICPNCAAMSKNDLEKAILDKIRDSFLPDLRKIEINQNAGKA